MNPLFQRALTSVFRALLLLGSGWFVRHGIWSSEDAAEYVGAAAVALATIAWGVWTHFKSLQKENTTIALLNKLTGPEVPVVTSADIAMVIKSGDKASTLTAPTQVPVLTGTGNGMAVLGGTGDGSK